MKKKISDKHLENGNRRRLLFSFACTRPSTLKDTLGLVTANLGGDPWCNLTVSDVHYLVILIIMLQNY